MQEKIQEILQFAQQAASAVGGNAYLFGNILKYEHTSHNQFLKENVIDIILSVPSDFEVRQFYENFSKNVVINQEIENTADRYIVFSNEYVIQFYLRYNFSPTRLEDLRPIATFTMDALLQDLASGQLIDSSETGMKDLQDGLIRNFVDSRDWQISDLLGFATIYGSFEGPNVNNEQLRTLENLNLADYKEPINESISDILIRLLLTLFPGKALKFVRDVFPDGGDWLFENLISLMSQHNIPLREDVTVAALFSDQKLDLVDVYNEFFLFDKNRYETPKERNNRLLITLRLLFDSPSLDIKTPYIDKLSIMSATSASEEPEMEAVGQSTMGVRLFEEPTECEYGLCPPCVPEGCNPQCCCCHSSDVISVTRTRCHQQVAVSCDRTGTRPGPNSPTFNEIGCDFCQRACNVILGKTTGGDGQPTDCDDLIAIGTSEGWWSLPHVFQPCECNCAQVGGDGVCDLTCVFCNGLFCSSEVAVSGNDCHYNMDLTPSTGCCGTPATIDWMFVIDASGSMESKMTDVRDNVDALNRAIADDIGADLRVGLTIFGDNDPTPRVVYPFSTDLDGFVTALNDFIPPTGGKEYDWEAMYEAMTNATWGGNANFLMWIGDERSQRSPDSPCGDAGGGNGSLSTCISNVTHLANFLNITVYVVQEQSGPEYGPARTQLAIETGGQNFPFSKNLAEIASDLNITVFPTTCECLDYTPVPLRLYREDCLCCKNGITNPCIDDPFDFDCLAQLNPACFDIPINKCFPGQECTEEVCNQATPVNACGSLILIRPEKANLACCSDIGFGCDCEEPPTSGECCGPDCPGSEVCLNGVRQFDSLREAIDAVWCECFDKASFPDESTNGCTHCCCPDGDGPGDPNFPCEELDSSNPEHQELLESGQCCACTATNLSDCCECILHFADGSGGFDLIVSRQDVVSSVTAIWESCDDGGEEPPATWEPPNLNCRKDECIVGDPEGLISDDHCDEINQGCTSVHHPSTVVLNNGIGLVAYERLNESGLSSIRIQQYNTSMGNKILPNREFNFGRLQHNSQWTTTAKLYVFEDLPNHLLSGSETIDPDDPTSWKDAIAFKNGPLEKQILPLVVPPTGQDSVGTFIRFFAPPGLVNDFPSGDDVYDIKFFIFDFEDTGKIGSAIDESTEGSQYILTDDQNDPQKGFIVVDDSLFLPPHVYNGLNVPVAYPSIAAAHNYSDSEENAHHVFVAYQALEDEKWSVYMRHLRLSEYKSGFEQVKDAIDSGQVVTLASLGVTDVVYRIVGRADTCTNIDATTYRLDRTVAMEVLLPDGRDVLNPGLTGFWPSLVQGSPSGDFPKQKVFVQAVHSVIADRCPDQFGFNDIFYNWGVGDEFTVPISSISASGLFIVMTPPDDIGVGVGSFDPPLTAGGAEISSAVFGAVWFEDVAETQWSVMDNTSFGVLSKFKGLDISEPIPLAWEDQEHATRPVIKVNHNNDVFVTYESTETGVPHIKIIGTSTPSSSLPVGVFNSRDLDSTLNSFLSQPDFTFSRNVTLDTGINQLPDMFIDLNDVIHLTWQSNRDQEWEIYYANSETNFLEKRITNHAGKSMRSSIDGDDIGRLFITWHDDRFGGWEIMLAHFNGTRILPLSQQDPYLAALRNPGYDHFLNEIPLRLINDTNFTVCINNVIVDFYDDRLLTQLAFTVEQNDWPFAFTVPGSENDLTQRTWDAEDPYENFSTWAEVDPADPYFPFGLIKTGPEYDSLLAGSIISKINFTFTTSLVTDQVAISFRGSDTESDTLSDSQWSPWVLMTTQGESNYSSFGISDTAGRYKQVRIRFLYDTSIPIALLLTVTSMSLHRTCIPPNSEITANLDLTPEIRIDKLGSNTAEFPIPIGFARNNTYFIRVRGIDDNNSTIIFPDPQTAASCESCSAEASTWNLEACTMKITATNSGSEDRYYNFRVRFYYDAEKTRKIVDFDAFPGNPDLRCFTVNNNQSAEDRWTSLGFRVPPNNQADVLLWPSLSPTSGLLCGIKYTVEIQSCFVTEEATGPCDTSSLSTLDNETWRCNCQSLRWSPALEDSPVNLREVVQWRSSADGGSDTRITETINTNNLNPVIKMRSNLNGVIVYETNRTEPSEQNPDYNRGHIYASVFSIVPSFGMYASAAQNITSPFESFVHRADIPICTNTQDKICGSEGNLCNTCKDGNPTLEGRQPAIALDQYDSLFLAAEQLFDQATCTEFLQNKQQSIVVHRCGADGLDLFEAIPSGGEDTQECSASEILGKSFLGNLTSSFVSIVRKIQVQNEFVSYHITRNGVTAPVVNACNIKFTVIGTPDTVSIRLSNSSQNFNEWFPMDPELGENTIEVDWRLSPGRGTKLVTFQAATYAGLTQSGTIQIIADYSTINFNVRFYRWNDAPIPPSDPDITNSAIWVDGNVLSEMDGVPIAAIRPPTVDNNVLIIQNTDYVYVELQPSQEYMKQFEDIDQGVKDSGDAKIEPSFDFIHQGGRDVFSIGTKYARTDAGIEVFRGVVQINTEDRGNFQDGLAFITPHFINDCADASVISGSSESFEKDKFNVVVSGVPGTTVEALDPFATERDASGLIEHKITIRPTEDPYFIFGDPNYRLHREHDES